ncbi:MAG: SIMPL domain-containing protein [Hyphomonas sp.]
MKPFPPALVALLLAAAPVACAQLPFASAGAPLPASPAVLAMNPNSVQPETTLTITAEARIDVQPDIAYVSAGVSEERTSASEAMAAQAAAMNAVIGALGKAGIAPEDMQTSGLSLYPRYDYLEHAQSDGSIRGEQKLAGYVSSNMISARVRRLDTLGATIDSLVEAGGNTFSGVTFALDNDRELKNQARTQAMKEALAKAELYANAAGLRVARIVTISEGYEYSPQPVMMARAEMAIDRAAPTPVAAGEVGVTASVSVLFELVK